MPIDTTYTRPVKKTSGSRLNNLIITAGGTSQQVLARNPSRKVLQIQNNSAQDLWINFGAAAAIDTGIRIATLQSWTSPPNLCPSDLVHAVGATTGNKFSVLEI